MTKTHNEFCNEINDRFNGKIVVIGQYVDEHTKIQFYCMECKIYFMTTPQSILHTQYGCKECGKKAIRQKLIRKNIEVNGRLVDKYPTIANQWDYDNNLDIDINDISPKSGLRVWWKCTKCGESYQAKVCAIVNGTGKCICKKCYLKSLPQIKVDAYVKTKGSFAEHYPELMNQWVDDLNKDINPYKVTDKCNTKVWWKCDVCGHTWKAKISKRTAGEGCPYCARHTKSSLQIKIENYINNKYDYQLLNEHGCVLKCYNPKTGYRLLYDNEVVINNNLRFIIECHGQQHYEVCGWTYTKAKSEGCAPEDILRSQQYRDKIKKDYALSQGYHYLEIPYTAEHNDQYQQLIDDKIHEILTLNTTK
jgi:predicted  nucleic acid-binding Zn-ribbon protein